MSTFGDYIKERQGKEIIEDDRGFATFQFLDDARCYIEDIYVRPDFRKRGVAKDMADKVAERAKSVGCKTLWGSVVPTAKGSTDSIKVLLAYGMSLDSSAVNLILFKKDL